MSAKKELNLQNVGSIEKMISYFMEINAENIFTLSDIYYSVKPPTPIRGCATVTPFAGKKLRLTISIRVLGGPGFHLRHLDFPTLTLF